MKKTYTIRLKEDLHAAATARALARGLTLSDYIADALLWQISHENKRQGTGKELYRGKIRIDERPQPLTGLEGKNATSIKAELQAILDKLD